eukprot:CAMPEP_0196807030 /NCGR_PEP_ID=MMETSP1362-20130617/6979_1 /TAXON_ID=163516 /ORGANISM="Leptocylindrus danicus, Strain CCMP1856" /LENGTH=232 /DNA_ID=CAMNT_0042180775 /DNA_START=72 /DNA_END=767 /DNA_ORIENTATION=-
MAKLKTAPPPLHTKVLVLVMTLIFAFFLPSMKTLDEAARIDTFTRCLFPDLIPIKAVAACRLLFASVIFGETVISVRGPGWVQETHYLEKSMLDKCNIKFVGWRTQTPFTSWSWILLGIAFLLAGLIPMIDGHGGSVPQSFLRIGLVSFEVAASAAMLVSAVIKYAIWPRILKDRGSAGTVRLRHWSVLMRHNANVIFVMLEVGLLGGLPVRLSEMAFAPLYGISYVLFSWW